MNKISESFDKLFDKAKLVTSCHSTITINEPDPKASFKSLVINSTGVDFDQYDAKPFLSTPNVFGLWSNSIENANCDGFSIATDASNKYTLIYTELKSKYSKNNFLTAYKQLVYSFVKSCEYLSLCKEFDFASLKIVLIIGCHGIESKEKYDEIKMFAEKHNQIKDSDECCNFFGNCMLNLVVNQKMRCIVKDLPFIHDLPLNDHILNVPVRLILSPGPDSISPNGIINLTI